jgi:L-arabinokinase
VVRHVIAAGHEVHVSTAVPEFVFTAELRSPLVHVRKVLLDCGAVQSDPLTVDPLASLEKVPRREFLTPVLCANGACLTRT